MGFNLASKGLKQRVRQFALRSINLVILFGMRRNCLRSGRSRSLYLSIKRSLVGKPEGKRPLGRPRHRWEDNIKMYLQNVGWVG